MTDNNSPTVPADFDIAAYWQFRMNNAAVADYTQPDNSLALFLAMPKATASVADLVEYANAKLTTFLTTAVDFNAGTSDQQVIVLCDGTNSTRADLALLALYGQSQPTGTKTWIDNNGKVTTLTGQQLVTLATVVGNWIADCYGDLASLIGQITASSPAITTTAQIDAHNWPTS